MLFHLTIVVISYIRLNEKKKKIQEVFLSKSLESSILYLSDILHDISY